MKKFNKGDTVTFNRNYWTYDNSKIFENLINQSFEVLLVEDHPDTEYQSIWIDIAGTKTPVDGSYFDPDFSGQESLIDITVIVGTIDGTKVFENGKPVPAFVYEAATKRAGYDIDSVEMYKSLMDNGKYFHMCSNNDRVVLLTRVL